MDEQFLTSVAAALRRADTLHAGLTLLVALSGGADSVALLRAVCLLAPRHGFAVRAAHVEHGLRGDASREDASFCERLCALWGVPLTVDHAALAGGMDAPGAEARAREARYALLLNRARECCAAALLLAHHLDDQAETVLSRLVRGSGARGLSGMQEATFREGVLVLRPLLTLPRSAILNALGNIPYRTDETNQMPCCQRNRLRKAVLPLLTAENPRAAEHIARSAALLSLDADYLDAQAEALLASALTDEPPFLFVDRGCLCNAPPALAVRALRRFVGQALGFSPQGAPPDERALSAADSLALLDLLSAPEGAALNLPGGLCALATAQRIHLVRMADGGPLRDAPLPTPVSPGERDWAGSQAGASAAAPTAQAPSLQPLGENGATVSFGNLLIRLAPDRPGLEPPPDGLRTLAVPDALLCRATLRLPRPGDRIRPFGTGGHKALRRYLTDRKIDPPFRPRLALLCVGDEVLWVVGVGAAEATRAGDAPATRLTVLGALPWLSLP